MSDREAMLAFDREHVWHPYGSLSGGPAPLAVSSARGVRLALADGRELVDGMSSWWSAIHGYRHPALDDAVTGQLGRMAHVMFGGLTHEPAVLLARRLLELAPDELDAVFFADSGSVSVEVAIKMSLQFQRARGRPGRTRLLTVKGGYHGDTFGAMAVCDPVGGMHGMFAGALAEHVFAERPPDGFEQPLEERWAEQVRALAARHAGELAAVVLEPVVQGAGGMRFHSPACVRLMRELCDEHELLLVLDEIATGFGRTGTLFACELAGIQPDLLCLGKGMTAGYLPMSATAASGEVFAAFLGPDLSEKTLYHGHSYSGNALGAAVALRHLELLDAWGVLANVQARSRELRDLLDDRIAPLPQVRETRLRGLMGGVELAPPRADLRWGREASAGAVRRGVLLRPIGDTVILMPPLTITSEELHTTVRALHDSITELDVGG
jgi:adenosylmethionine---8-amino-7-oxononanoate aminotransferase